MLIGSGALTAHAVEIQVWHSLSGPNRSTFEKIVSDFNRQNKGVTVDLKRFSSQEDLIEATIKAVKKGDKPDLVQLNDTHSPEVIAQFKEVLPLHQFLTKYPIKDANWFLEKTTSFVRDDKGRLLAFPFMAEIPIMVYNLDAYKRAGLDPKKPAETWGDLQTHLVKLRNETRMPCVYGSSHQVSIHLENLAPINDELYLKPDNGLGGEKNLTFNFGTLYMRHLSMMVSWKKTELLSMSTDNSEPDKAFAQGHCAILTTTSSALGLIRDGHVDFGIAPVPYYPQETKVPGAPFVTGGAFWLLNGHSNERNKGTSQFLSYLATPVVAAKWHQQTGYLPLTHAAFLAADVSFYDKTPGTRDTIAKLEKTKSKDSRGFRAPHYPKARVILNKGFETALEGHKAPMAVLQEAKKQAEQVIRTGK